MKTFMAFLLGYVEMELGTYYSKWLKRQNRPYRPVLYLSGAAGRAGQNSIAEAGTNITKPCNGIWSQGLTCVIGLFGQ